MNFRDYFSEQARQPSGLFGHMIMSRVFNIGNRRLNSIVKTIILSEHHERILEIGFGTGKLIRELALKAEGGIIEGIDFSDTMVDMAKKTNRRFIEKGEVAIRKGDFRTSEFSNDTFDLVFTINTVYFWKDPSAVFHKACNVLKNKGVFLAAFENMEVVKSRNLSETVFNFHTDEKIMELLKKAGFGSAGTVSGDGKTKNINIIKAVK